MSSKEFKIGYARVSTDRQDLGLEVQKEALQMCDHVFIEKESGAHHDRPQLLEALQFAKGLVEQGQTVSLVVYKLDRLTRSMFQLLEIIEDLNAHQIQLISLQEQLETDSLTGKLLCLILGYVAEIELENLRFRTREGLRKAREKGIQLGAKPLSKEKEAVIIQAYLHSEKSIREIAKTEQISTSTIYKVLKRNGIDKNRKIVCVNPCRDE